MYVLRQGELEAAIREVMVAKPFLLEVNDAQVPAEKHLAADVNRHITRSVKV